VRTDLPPLTGEDHVCAACPFSFPDHDAERAAAVVAGIPADARAIFAELDDAAVRRSRDGVWSAAEYLCHLRDVYATSTIRLHRARTEDDPAVEPMLNDLRAGASATATPRSSPPSTSCRPTSPASSPRSHGSGPAPGGGRCTASRTSTAPRCGWSGRRRTRACTTSGTSLRCRGTADGTGHPPGRRRRDEFVPLRPRP
jgi:hypothetical protein